MEIILNFKQKNQNRWIAFILTLRGQGHEKVLTWIEAIKLYRNLLPNEEKLPYLA